MSSSPKKRLGYVRVWKDVCSYKQYNTKIGFTEQFYLKDCIGGGGSKMKRQNAQSLPTFRHLLHFFTAAFVTHTTPKRVANFLQQKMDSEKGCQHGKVLNFGNPT